MTRKNHIKRIIQVCLVSGLLLAAGFVLVSCTYNIENNTNYIDGSKQGTVILTLENHLAELGSDVSAIQASKYKVDIFNNGVKADTFTVDVSVQTKFVSDTRTATVSKTYKAGEYTAVIYAQDANGRNFGKGSLDFNIIGDTTVSKTVAVEYKMHTVKDFVKPTKYYYSEDTKYYAYLTNTQTQPYVKYVEIKDFLIHFMGGNTNLYTSTLTADGTVYRITNTVTNSYLEIDTNNETMRFSNFEAFTHSSSDAPLVTAVSSGVGTVVNQYDIPGNAWTFSYGHYMVGDDSGSIYSLDITPFKKADGTACCYIPFNICTDLYIFWQNINFNGKAFVQSGTKAYYDSNLSRTQAVKEFNFIEFCFNMDMNYGLAKEHGITNGFASWLKNLDGGSVYNKLMSEETTDLREAYYQIVYKYFGDIHSSYENRSFYEPAEYTVPTVRTLITSNPSDFSVSWQNFIKTYDYIQYAKANSGLLKVIYITDTYAVADYEGLQLWGYNTTTKEYEKIEFSYVGSSDTDVGTLVVTTNLTTFSNITLFVTFNNFIQDNSNNKYMTKPDYYWSETTENYSYKLRNGVIKHYGLFSTAGVEYKDTDVEYDSSTDFMDTRSLTKIANQLVQEYDNKILKESKEAAEEAAIAASKAAEKAADAAEKAATEEAKQAAEAAKTAADAAEEAAKQAEEKEEIAAARIITNIVVDLSCNGGGSINAGAYIGSWLMGQFNECVQNPVTGAGSVTTYMFDVNGDGKVGETYGNYQEGDTVCNKSIFAITSQCTFSCANLLACKLNEAGKTVILGSTSGGGACCVLSLATVDGTCLNVSSNLKFCNEKNGSFSSIDQGVAPYKTFTSWDKYANRAYITQVVNDL